MEPTQAPQVDPTALSLSRAIRAAEGGDYNNTAGDAGTSAGAYQWNNGKVPLQKGQIPANFRSQAQSHGLNPDDFSPENQDHVAYEEIKRDLDSGLTQSQVAAKWNSGLTHGWENHVGDVVINGKTVHYDTPNYVAKVQKYYESADNLPDNKGYNPQPYSNPSTPGQFDFTGIGANSTKSEPDTSTIGGQVANRLNEASGAITEVGQGVSGVLKGDLTQAHHIASGALQTVGAGAGLLGDVVNKGLELIPGVKQVEDLIGHGVGSLVQTPSGQAVVQSIKDFSEQHPELSKDIGAGFNIITALPILKGLGVAKNVAMDAVSQSLKSVAERSATQGLEKVISTTKTGRNALAHNSTGIKTLVDERALPEVENGKYVTKTADEKLDAEIAHIDDSELQPALDSGTNPNVSSRIPVDVYEKNAIAEAVSNLLPTGPVKQAFKLLRSKYGDYMTAQQMNEAKRLISKNISEAGYNSPTRTTDKIVRSTLQTAVEDWGKATGNPEINAINAKMRALIQAQKLLKHVDGKSVKTGLIGKAIQMGAGAAGEALGATTGVPIVGAYGAYKGAGMLEKAFAGHNVQSGILNRTGKDAVRTTKKQIGKGGTGLIGGALTQKAVQR